MPEITTAILEPVHPRTFFVEPFLPSGFHPSGLYLQYDDRLYPMFGRVLKTHPTCSEVKPGDVVLFPPMAWTQTYLGPLETLRVMDERVVDAVIEGFDTEAVLV